MAVTAFASGTQTTTVTTEHTLASVNVAGVFTLVLDLNALATGDVVEVRAYQMALTGGTSRVAFVHTFYGAQPADGKVAVSLPLSNELTDTDALKFTLKQTYGSSRSIPFKILQHG